MAKRDNACQTYNHYNSNARVLCVCVPTNGIVNIMLSLLLNAPDALRGPRLSMALPLLPE